MLEDSKLKASKKRHAHKLMDKQWEYNDSLADAGRFDRLPKFYKVGYEVWSSQRKMNLSSYKKARFVISSDGESVELIIPSKSVWEIYYIKYIYFKIYLCFWTIIIFLHNNN